MKRFFCFFLPCLFALFLAFGCSPRIKKEGPPLVLAGLPPYLGLVERLAGSWVESRSLIAPTADPHLFEVTPRDLANLDKAILLIGVGEPFEKKVAERLSQSNKQFTFLNLSQKLPILSCHDPYTISASDGHSHHHHHTCSAMGDLHFWLSPQMMSQAAELVCQELLVILPQYKDKLLENLAAFHREMDELNQKIEQIVTPYKESGFITSHAAFTYFSHDYHIYQIAIEAEGKQALLKDLKTLMHTAKTHKATFVIVQPQHENKGALIMAQKLHLPSFLVNPYEKDFKSTMITLAELIANNGSHPQPKDDHAPSH